MKLKLKLLTAMTLCLMPFYGQAATLSSVNVACSAPTNVFLSETLRCTATAYYSDGTNKVVTATPTTSWSVVTSTPTTFSSISKTPFSTINQSGQITKNPGPKDYKFTAQAVYKEGGITKTGVSSALLISGIDGRVIASDNLVCKSSAQLVSKVNWASAYYSKACHAKWIVTTPSMPPYSTFGRFSDRNIFTFVPNKTTISSKALYSYGSNDEVFVTDGMNNAFLVF